MIKFDDIEYAFMFVSGAAPFINRVYIDRVDGTTYFTSELGDSDALPDDIDDGQRYARIPHKNDLDLGRALVDEFVSERAPRLKDPVWDLFRRRGAYSRFKALLDRHDLLDDWCAFEEARSEAKRRGGLRKGGSERLRHNSRRITAFSSSTSSSTDDPISTIRPQSAASMAVVPNSACIGPV